MATIRGSFIGTGGTITVAIPGGVDSMSVYNYTKANAASGAGGTTSSQFYWQNGFNNNDGLVWQRNAGGTANLQITSAALAVGGFTPVDTSINTPSAPIAITGLSAANPPVITTATAAAAGTIIRLSNLNNQPQFATMDFSVTAANTLGTINGVNSVASTAGFYRTIPYQPMFYPPSRAITFVLSVALNVTRISLSVIHQYTIGQQVRLNFPGGSAVWGNFAQLDGVQCQIIGINTATGGNEPTFANNITVNVDSSTLGAWVFATAFYPTAAYVPFTPARVVPIGEAANNTIIDLNGNPLNSNLLDDAMTNVAFVGMSLAGGANSPAGQAADVIYWWAETSFN